MVAGDVGILDTVTPLRQLLTRTEPFVREFRGDFEAIARSRAQSDAERAAVDDAAAERTVSDAGGAGQTVSDAALE